MVLKAQSKNSVGHHTLIAARPELHWIGTGQLIADLDRRVSAGAPSRYS
jgi:hypothetical protein